MTLTPIQLDQIISRSVKIQGRILARNNSIQSDFSKNLDKSMLKYQRSICKTAFYEALGTKPTIQDGIIIVEYSELIHYYNSEIYNTRAA